MKKYTHNGETLSPKEWALRLGISLSSFYQRINDMSDLNSVFQVGPIRNIYGPNIFHGKSRSKSYSSWRDMMRRCYDPKSKKYHRYGARGLTVIKRWHSFENFYIDMGERPNGFTLDRINNNKGYNKKNCRWATPHQQSRNISTNRIVMIGSTKMILKDAANFHNISYSVVRQRIFRGWAIKKALTTPPLRK